ncbi:MAG: hypothetical protein M1269_09415 [Chloroflexi bacterium]|nr:hypothetical protein [Chloroflexota bacterium]
MEINFKKRFLKEIEIAKDIFGINNELVPRKGINEKDVLKYLSLIQEEIWPPRLTKNLWPKPQYNELRGFYWGSYNVNNLANVICRQSLFFEKILLLDPLALHADAKGPEGPYRNPKGWIPQIVRDSIYICSLKDWVEKDIISVFPAQSSLNPKAYFSYGNRMLSEYGEKLDDLIMKNEKDFLLKIMTNSALALNKKTFINTFNNVPDWSDEFLDDFYEDVKRQNPIRYIYKEIMDDDSVTDDYSEYVLFDNKICNLVEARDIGSATGSIIFSDDNISSSYLRYSDTEYLEKSFIKELQNICYGIQNLEFLFLNGISLNDVLRIREKGYLTGFRNLLRDLWRSIPEVRSLEDLYSKIKEFNDKLVSEYRKYEEDMDSITKETIRNIASNTLGNKINQIAGASLAGASLFISGRFNWEFFFLGIAVLLAQAFKPISNSLSKKENLQKNPLYVLYQLEKSKKL